MKLMVERMLVYRTATTERTRRKERVRRTDRFRNMYAYQENDREGEMDKRCIQLQVTDSETREIDFE